MILFQNRDFYTPCIRRFH